MTGRRMLMGCTALPLSYPDLGVRDRTGERIRLAAAYLGRRPFALFDRVTGRAYWVESEPADWGDFLDQIEEHEGGIEAVISQLKNRGVLH